MIDTLPRHTSIFRSNKRQNGIHISDAIVRQMPDERTELMHIHSLFPFDLFPDTLIVDYNMVTVKYHSIPPLVHIETIPIEVITDVVVTRGFILAKLSLIAANVRNPITITISKLKPSDALCAHRLIECLMALKREHRGDGSKVDTQVTKYDALPN